MHRFALVVVLGASLTPAIAPSAFADPRPFTFSNDTYPMGKGEWEYEQWLTYRTHKEDDSDYQRFDFRHEFEFGLADNFDLAVYLPTWRYEDTDDFSGTQFDSIDVEGIIYLSNPVNDFLGVGLYGEVKIGDDSLGFENKLLLQKDVGKWIFLYNLVLETEIEGAFSNEQENEVEGELKHTAGVSYAIVPGWFLGAEAIVESVYEDWSHYEGTTVYAGPALSYQGAERFWFTVTPTYQLTDNEGEADFQIRLIAALQF
jgi:hypothetical protein